LFQAFIADECGASVNCTICGKRKAVRYCPAKGERICAVCCGTEREVTIDCAVDCSYLLAAHRYEDEHRRPVPADTPLLDVSLPQDVVYTHQKLIAALTFSIAKFCASQPAATDPDVLAALQAVAETHKTMISGIFYEQPPRSPLPRELYAAVMALLAEIKKQQAEKTGFAALKDSQIFHALVFLYRMGLLRTNSRPKSRRFIEFLRAQFPQSQELKKKESRIIVP
jgi:DNA-binding transcriptional LysR family regulator